MDMSNWKSEYRKAMQALVLKNGTPVDPNPSPYGWIHSESEQVRAHVKEGEPVVSKFREATWHEFMGTFYEGDTSEHGVEVTVSCKCGQFKDVTYRWQATPGEMLTLLLEEDGDDE